MVEDLADVLDYTSEEAVDMDEDATYDVYMVDVVVLSR